MVKTIRNIVNRMFPEIRGKYHLSRDGRIEAIADPPDDEDGTATDDFRPYYAVDVQLLNADGTDDTDHPIMEALPLPAMMVGDESGQFGFPKIGTKVVICFRYGSPGHPYIHSILPQGLAVPPCELGEQIWQHSPGIHKKVDKEGNWERITSGKITDDSQDREIIADSNLEEYGESTKNVEGDDLENIEGTKKIESLGSIVLKAANSLTTCSIGDSAQTSLQNHTEVIGKELTQIIGEGAQIDIVLGQYLVSGLIAEFGFDETGLIVCENSITSLKDWLNAFVDEVSKIIVTMGTSPNVAKLIQLKIELGFLLK